MIELPTDRLIALIENRDEAAARQRAFEHDYLHADLVESGLTLGGLMLLTAGSYENPHIEYPNVDNTAYDLWLQQTKADRLFLGNILTNWVMVSRMDFALYPIFLYNKDYGRTRELFNTFLTRDFPPPPYLFLLFLNALHHAAGLSYEEIAPLYVGDFEPVAPIFHKLFSGSAFDDWFDRAPMGLRYYGGATNTILGLYDEYFTDPSTGAHLFNRDAQALYDLGGGYNTPEIERLIGRQFVSADIVAPRYADYDEDIAFLGLADDGKTRRVVFGDEREDFLRRQREVVYQPFNVHNDSFPDDKDSYGIVSTGFMTSTVRPQEMQPEWATKPAGGYGHVALSIQAMIRVLELVKKGKAVDLFTVQRAGSRVYKYKTCFLQWRAGKLTTMQTTDDVGNHKRFTEDKMAALRAKVHPDFARFNRYLKD